MPRGRKAKADSKPASTLQETKAVLWAAADKLRDQMDAAEYKHLVLGLIFLKYISDSFDAQRRHVRKELTDPTSEFFVSEDFEQVEAALEDRDWYVKDNVFWVPALNETVTHLVLHRAEGTITFDDVTFAVTVRVTESEVDWTFRLTRNETVTLNSTDYKELSAV